MYSKRDTSRVKKEFWAALGQYLRPIKSVSGETVNWLNYKTGVRNFFFRMDAGSKNASVSIEVTHGTKEERDEAMMKLKSFESFFNSGNEWNWMYNFPDEDGKIISRISRNIENVNIMNRDDWPRVISFLKQGIIELDAFWFEAKDFFLE